MPDPVTPQVPPGDGGEAEGAQARGDLLARAIHEDVRLAPYDAGWPALFLLEEARLRSSFPRWLAIEHIGSTAVPGMPAKPIIDILAAVPSLAAADADFDSILACGYTTSREFNATLTDRRWFMRAAGGRRTHHLHVVVHMSAVWQDRLRFRALLRQDPILAQAYSQLKSALAGQFRHDREAYTEAKAAFVAAAVTAR